MFRFAEENDRRQLYSLWHNCFGDGEKYVYSFFDTFLGEDNVYVCEEKGKIVSVVYSLDCEIDGKKAQYFYAVATDESFRRQGLAKKEIEFLIDYKTKQGTEIFLLTPSNEKNRSYYKTLGFEDFFFCEKKVFSKGKEKAEISEEYQPSELYNLREKVFSENSFVSFPEKHFYFALMFSEKIFTWKKEGKTVAYALTDGKKITELCSEENEESFVSAVLEKTDVKSAEIYVPLRENTVDDSCKISRGMVYCSNKDLKEKLKTDTFLSLNLE
ncbi:MAG: GNAT family N-acetyltransferase [Clostridia bacterium]|nr:GNAT family N-acetyltransferase [Clostridia bacterium]